MKKYAQVIDNLIANIASFDDSEPLPIGWVDVSLVPSGLGWPISGGVPLEPPDRWYTVTGDHLGWEITTENQTAKDEFLAAEQRKIDIINEQDSTGMKGLTVDEAKQIVTDKIDIVRALPESTLAEIQAKISELCDQTEWLFHKVVVFLLR